MQRTFYIHSLSFLLISLLVLKCEGFRSVFGRRAFERRLLSQAIRSPLHSTVPADVFCNVELNAAYIEAVGFDMDFTLARVRGNCKSFYGKAYFVSTITAPTVQR